VDPKRAELALSVVQGLLHEDAAAERMAIEAFDSLEDAATAYAYLVGFLIEDLADARRTPWQWQSPASGRGCAASNRSDGTALHLARTGTGWPGASLQASGERRGWGIGRAHRCRREQQREQPAPLTF
jgi:hypothetical protein